MCKNEKGATLVEAMIATALLTIGILAAMTMQIKAIGASSTAMNRTEANSVSLALLETFRRLDLGNANLAPTTATVNELLNVSTRQQLQALITNGKIRTFAAAGLPEMQPLINVPAGGVPAGTIIDHSGISYQLAWAVQDQALLDGSPLNKNIWIIMIWDSPMGVNRSIMFSQLFHQ